MLRVYLQSIAMKRSQQIMTLKAPKQKYYLYLLNKERFIIYFWLSTAVLQYKRVLYPNKDSSALKTGMHLPSKITEVVMAYSATLRERGSQKTATNWGNPFGPTLLGPQGGSKDPIRRSAWDLYPHIIQPHRMRKRHLYPLTADHWDATFRF